MLAALRQSIPTHLVEFSSAATAGLPGARAATSGVSVGTLGIPRGTSTSTIGPTAW